MQFTLVLAIFTAFAAIGAASRETNAQRMARGLPPLPPVKRTPVASAMRRQASGSGGDGETPDTKKSRLSEPAKR